jgi:hypothetical protein
MTSEEKWAKIEKLNLGELYSDSNEYEGSILDNLLEMNILEHSEYKKLYKIMKISINLDGGPLDEPYGILYINLLYNILETNKLIK